MKIFKTVFIFLFPIILITSCSNDEGSDEEKEEEQMEITLEGDYLGLWNSTTDTGETFNDFPVSAKISFANIAETKLRAEFFATSSFRSCCKDDGNDGTMNMDLNGDEITSFRFNDQIVDCSGSFAGTGSVTSKSPYTIKIDFSGSDCDGEHTGTLLFTRTNN